MTLVSPYISDLFKYDANRSIFKIYMLDVGLLGAMAKLPLDMPVQGVRLFDEYEGAFAVIPIDNTVLSNSVWLKADR